MEIIIIMDILEEWLDIIVILDTLEDWLEIIVIINVIIIDTLLYEIITFMHFFSTI